MVLGVGLLLILVRALSVESYAFYILSISLLEIVLQVSSLGLLVVAQRYLPELLAHGQGSQLSRLLGRLSGIRFLTLVLFSGLIFYCVVPIAESFGFEQYAPWVRIYLLVIILEGFARFADVVFDSLLLQGYSQASLILRSALRLGFVSALFFHSSEQEVTLEQWIWIDVGAAGVGCLFAMVAMWMFSVRIRLEQPGDEAPLDYRRFSRYALPTYFAATLYTASGVNTVKLIAAKSLSISQFGAFGFAAAFSAMLQRYLPLFLLIGMIRPLFVAARQRQDYGARLTFLARLVFHFNVFALLPALVFVLACGEHLVASVTGGKFPEAAGYLIAFLLILITQAMRAIVSMVAQSMEEGDATVKGTLLGLLGLFAGLGLVPYFGGYGLCVGLCASEVLFSAWLAHVLRQRGINLLPSLNTMLRLLLAAFVALIASTLFLPLSDDARVIQLGGMGLLIGVTYLFVSWFLKPFSMAERDTINTLLKRRIFVW